ncbi:DUF6292 family protein [Actinophytocola oryzae]|uniref:DUF6292 domain-containing protein n=1 Tax=Actinophytocola oryzae TaxID=502181 RepID=A0A4R7UZV3_9PSEU|nr:DUF6292 family protein [Actinophytocola oryzae]TDV41702.1 hypothetical protein CLV71_11924 [Actinophytocola oryzae]
MTSHPRSQFVEARTHAARERTDQQQRAVRTVAGQARDHTEFTAMLSMLGLEQCMSSPTPLGRRLAVYVDHVAAAVGVPTEATGYEVSDTATAYLGLDRRLPSRPDHDLMLLWDERLGWYVAVETTPAEGPAVVAYLDGDTVPTPDAVARFVTDLASDRSATRIRPVSPPTDRAELATRMGAVCPVPA